MALLWLYFFQKITFLRVLNLFSRPPLGPQTDGLRRKTHNFVSSILEMDQLTQTHQYGCSIQRRKILDFDSSPYQAKSWSQTWSSQNFFWF